MASDTAAKKESGTAPSDCPRRTLTMDGTVAPTASIARCTKSMPTATASVATYPTTTYPTTRARHVGDSDDFRGARDGATPNPGPAEPTAESGRIVVSSGMEAPPNNELFDPTKHRRQTSTGRLTTRPPSICAGWMV